MASQSVGAKVAGVAWYAFRIAFGLTSLAGVWATAVLKDGVLWAKDTEEEKQELDTAQKEYWSLEREPLPGFRHAFFRTRDGLNLHYVVNADADASAAKNVAIFIHGFPDSFLLWRHLLQSPELQRNHVLIAIDLPGYGGSDNLPAYGPNEILEALTEYMLGMRKLFLHEDRRMIVVTHDWGTIIGARLASEAGALADRWVITSAIIPQLQRLNATTNMALAKQMFHTWIRQPLNLRLLKNAVNVLGPILSQFRRSFYIFCFHLPRPFSAFFSTFGNYWFLRVMHSLSKGRPKRGEQLIGRLDPKEAGEAMAISTGPGMLQLQESAGTDGSLRYGESVRKRVHDRGMSEKIRIYREQLAFGKWEKSLETTAALFEISSYSSTSSNDGHLHAPTTLMLGEHDPAFDRRLALNGVKEFLVPGSQVLLVNGSHWLPLEVTGRRVLEQTVLWALSENTGHGNAGDGTPFAAMGDVKVVAEA